MEDGALADWRMVDDGPLAAGRGLEGEQVRGRVGPVAAQPHLVVKDGALLLHSGPGHCQLPFKKNIEV